jgi:hypothetical protein
MSENVDTKPVQRATRTTADFTWLRDFLNSSRSYAHEETMILESPGVSYLYHYTDLPGFKGIIDAGDLWLTHLRFSNDHEELTYGREVARDVIEQRLRTAAGDTRSYLERLQQLLEQPFLEGVYICCFCEKNNLLSQWRGYGANGTGVCLKFEKTRFAHLTGADCAAGFLRLWKVFYRRDQQVRIIEKALDFAWQFGDGTIEQRATRAAEAIQFFIPTFKNPDFSEEEEWRLMFTPDPQLPVPPAFRTSRNMLVPYFGLQQLGWGDAPLPLVGICIGPGTHKEINAQSARMLLDARKYGLEPAYRDVAIDVSRTPYRG